jgi:hypothetical protein
MQAQPVGVTRPLERAGPPSSHARGRGTRHRLAALGSDVGDVVASVGGLLCDRSMAGWDVHVFLDDPCNHRSLQVLGVRAADLRAARVRDADDDWPDVLLVSAALYTSREWVRRHISAAGRNPTTEVAIWGGEDMRADLPKHLRREEHRLSTAARAFKEIAVSISTDFVAPVASMESLLAIAAAPSAVRSTTS